MGHLVSPEWGEGSFEATWVSHAAILNRYEICEEKSPGEEVWKIRFLGWLLSSIVL